MRLWGIHPKYLDAKGLVALWRESLLAKKVLEGKTRGYQHHPQLDRFKAQTNPVAYINSYLVGVLEESCRRGYCFDKTKIGRVRTRGKIKVTKAELAAEFEHLKGKLKRRDKKAYSAAIKIKVPEPHPLFRTA
jgi:hypothetical protein